jgi:hypothetical protein
MRRISPNLTMAGLRAGHPTLCRGRKVGWPGRARFARCPAMEEL